MQSGLFYFTAGFLFIWWHIINLLWKLIDGIRVHFILRWTNDRINLVEKFGDWAVVTGATDGIGKAYSAELAKRGVNVVLVSRTLEKLESTAAELENQYNIKTKIIQVDFSLGFLMYEKLENELKDIPIGILVNNVGMFFSYPLFFTEIPPNSLNDIININISSTLMMTRIVLPMMKTRRKGAIVFMSSILELSSHPMNTIYSSTKRFLRSFYEGLEPDCRNHGVTLQRLTPSFIKTSLSSFARSTLGSGNIIVPTAEAYASSAINTLGRKNVTTGYWIHSLQYYFMERLPKNLICNVNELFARRFKAYYFYKQRKKS